MTEGGGRLGNSQGSAILADALTRFELWVLRFSIRGLRNRSVSVKTGKTSVNRLTFVVMPVGETGPT